MFQTETVAILCFSLSLFVSAFGIHVRSFISFQFIPQLLSYSTAEIQYKQTEYRIHFCVLVFGLSHSSIVFLEFTFFFVVFYVVPSRVRFALNDWHKTRDMCRFIACYHFESSALVIRSVSFLQRRPATLLWFLYGYQNQPILYDWVIKIVILWWLNEFISLFSIFQLNFIE